MDLFKDIEEYDLVFIDLETTGLDVITGDAICEIGAFKIKNRKVIGKFHSLVNPGKPVPKEAYQVHKISDEDLKNAPYFKDIATKLIAFLADSVLCAYNISFDLGFINYQLKKIEYSPLDLPAIDILAMARDILKLTRYDLATTAKYFNISIEGILHRALNDANLACRVFFKLQDILKEKKVNQLGQILSLYGFANDIFKVAEDRKTTLLQDAIQKVTTLKIRFFSPNNTIEEEDIIPLRILQDNKYYYLLYQKSKTETLRIKLNRILEVNALK
ncbi:MAG: 3'-5' exoribonuclease [Candidatus Omnitrophica bacterium]|jgi:DNA polymerase III epsilon subunit|nr:3'-5' exoribonuclease [Candidatus Omnitrophota bacterium]